MNEKKTHKKWVDNASANHDKQRELVVGIFAAKKARTTKKCLLHKIAGARNGDQQKILTNVRNGLPYYTIETLADAFEVSRKEISEALSIPISTLNRRKNSGRLLPVESDRVARLARLMDLAVSMMNGNNSAAVQWLKTPLLILGEETPLMHANTELGAREVENLMGRLQHGTFS